MTRRRIPHIFCGILFLALGGCAGGDATNDAGTGDPGAPPACRGEPDPERICTQQYEPVCGCDGRTYGNACTAAAAGVLRHEPGACGASEPPEG